MSKLRNLNRALLVLLLSFAVGSRELKADVTGSILGAVTDAQAGVLPGIEVTATNLETNQKQSTRTDNLGALLASALAPPFPCSAISNARPSSFARYVAVSLAVA